MKLDVALDYYSIRINGKREFILSGAIHYYRLPSRELWPRRLALLKECGFNAVDVYYAWNYHSPHRGEYDFKGIRDVDYLHKCVEDAGLYLIARPGPYICSEVDAGGFPGWLLSMRNVRLRCRDASGKIEIDREYMDCVREWYAQIVPKILKCENLILFQIENEFMSLPHLQGPLGKFVTAIRNIDPTLLIKMSASEHFRFLNARLLPQLRKLLPGGSISTPNPYIGELYRMTREMGVGVPLFHNDVQSASDRVAEVDFAAIDDYALNMYSDDWRGKKNTFAGTDAIEEGHDMLQKDTPIFIAEFQGSWFDMWGGRGYDHIRKIFGTDQLDIATKTALAQRSTLINYFMFIGGTTWGYMASPDVYSSYDLAAPVAECGAITERFYVLKWLAENINRLCPDILETKPDTSVKASNINIFCRARKSTSGRRYVFLRNLELRPRNTRLNITDEEFTVEPVSMLMLVFAPGGKLEEIVGPYNGEGMPDDAANKRRNVKLPQLETWTLGCASPQIAADFDDSDWAELEPGGAMDIDSLGYHYGFAWYRGTYSGRIEKLTVDARHCFSMYLNGRLVGSRDNSKNFTGAGPDLAESFKMSLPAEYHNPDKNVITILVESLGHNKDFECDARNPRGIVKIEIGGTAIKWRHRGGLLPGEKGLCPILPKSSFKSATKKTKIALPHFWELHEEGLRLYETDFDLSGKLHSKSSALGLVIPDAYSKANIYLNGALVGRYWNEKGPQHKFYLPWGILKSEGANHLAIAVWKRWNKGGLGRVQLELY